jgi:hypothetical protein
MTICTAGIKNTSETDRMWERTACKVPVSVILHPTNFLFQATIYNMCNAGVYLESGYPIQLSQTLILRLSAKPPRTQHEHLRESVFYLGEVVWIRNLVYSLTADYGLGIRLLLCERKQA